MSLNVLRSISARIRPRSALFKGRREAVLTAGLTVDAMQAIGFGTAGSGAVSGGLCAVGEGFCRVQCGLSG